MKQCAHSDAVEQNTSRSPNIQDCLVFVCALTDDSFWYQLVQKEWLRKGLYFCPPCKERVISTVRQSEWENFMLVIHIWTSHTTKVTTITEPWKPPLTGLKPWKKSGKGAEEKSEGLVEPDWDETTSLFEFYRKKAIKGLKFRSHMKHIAMILKAGRALCMRSPGKTKHAQSTRWHVFKVHQDRTSCERSRGFLSS